jgi:3'-phosphoadenosine 5'-phosphosulfate sulfotransferase (PAPS reductase)/FAD synthetase
MMDAVRLRYGVSIEVILPDPNEVERMVARHGLNLFRADPSFRKLCCHLRKVRPLKTASTAASTPGPPLAA